MIKKLLIILIIFFIPAMGFAVTVTQTGAGADLSVAQFNALTGNKAGTTYYFSGTITSGIVVNIYGADGNRVILDGYAADDTTYANLSEATTGRAEVNDESSSGDAIDIYGDYVTVQDFEITKTDLDSDSSEGIMIRSGADYVTVKRCFIYEVREGIQIGGNNAIIGGSLGQGVVIKNVGVTTADADIVTNGGDYYIISYNHIYSDSSSWGVDGITAGGGSGDGDSYGLIEYNSIHGHQRTSNGEDGIDLKYNAHHVIVRYNNIYDNNTMGVNLSNGPHHDIWIYGNNIYGNGSSIYLQNRTVVPLVYFDHYNIYIFSNIIKTAEVYGVQVASNDTAANAITIFNNTFISNSSAPTSSAHTSIYVQASDNVSIKNNIFYNSRPNESDYRHIYIADNADDNTNLDYNMYYSYFGSQQTSQVYGGSCGYEDIADLYSQCGYEQNGSDADPGLTSIAVNDYRIDATGSGAVSAGQDMGDGNIASLTINGLTVNVPWDFALGPNTVWGSGSTLPVIDVQRRDDHQWDIGAYVFTTDTSPPIVTVVADSPAIAYEDGTTTATWTLHCSPTCGGAPGIDVTYALSGTATGATSCGGAGDDYSLTSLTTINVQDLSQVVTITACDDAVIENNETAILTVTEEAAYDVGTLSNDTLYIYSDDGGYPIYDYGVNKVRGAKLK